MIDGDLDDSVESERRSQGVEGLLRVSLMPYGVSGRANGFGASRSKMISRQTTKDILGFFRLILSSPASRAFAGSEINAQ